ncbi:hypothetical protein TELCIR_08056 [Teladorsagia circumcincta]|uniref:Peptidase A2 domain-containing protein n=1 Tax=Teladorsagia circumcincta TaxID=45464 RepID=A0A2G9UIM3_TELCI|nr:hypothetical protein TELCIR_08056 [Teladorsagia circumcincta]
MLCRLDTQAEDAPLTIEDLRAECENLTASKMDNVNMESSRDVHAVQKKEVKCSKCGGPHYRNVCPLLANQPKMSSQIPNKPRRQHHRRKRDQCKNIATFAAENARTYINVDVRGHSIRFQLDTGADITLIYRRRWKKLGSSLLKSCPIPVKTADGSPMKIGGRFSTDFSVKDRTTGNQFRGNGYCYVTESTNLLGLEWCVQLPAYKKLQEKHHCRMETAEGGKGPRKVKMEKQFNRHHRARERSYQTEEPVWIRDYRPGQKRWILAHVKSRLGRVLFDVLTEEGQLWRRHANQMRATTKENNIYEDIQTLDDHFWSEDRQQRSKEAQYEEEEKTTLDFENYAMDRTKSPASPQTTDRCNRQRRPPSRLQVNPKMKTYVIHST